MENGQPVNDELSVSGAPSAGLEFSRGDARGDAVTYRHFSLRRDVRRAQNQCAAPSALT